jgi:hypothetical protein
MGAEKILLEGVGNSNRTNTASNTRLRLTTQVGQAHVTTVVPLDLGTNTQPNQTHQHAQRKLARLAAYAATVIPMACTGQTGEQPQSDRLLQQPHNKRSRKPQ